jgi:preprotein translocase subunit SecG
MTLLIGFLSFVLILTSLFLILLILIQLPKKEAGAGVAFGASTTDALFGAGSGNALTNATKYAGTLFIGLAIVLSLLYMHRSGDVQRRIEQELLKQAGTAPVAPLAAPGNALSPTNGIGTNVLAPTNAPANTTNSPTSANPATTLQSTPAGTPAVTPGPGTISPAQPKTEQQPQTPATTAPPK